VSGTLEPRAGIQHLMRVQASPQTQACADLAIFTSLSWDWDSADEGFIDAGTVRNEVITQARRMIAQGGVGAAVEKRSA